MYSRQHYISIAELLRNSHVGPGTALAQQFIKLFEADNERFNEERFKRAIKGE